LIFLAIAIIGENHAAARAAQGLVRRGRRKMSVRKWRRMRASRHEPGKMSDVDHEISADRIADLPEPREIPMA
jgi:hypothetical protein